MKERMKMEIEEKEEGNSKKVIEKFKKERVKK